jgi:hypothetical protein
MAPILTRVIRNSKVFWIEFFRFGDFSFWRREALEMRFCWLLNVGAEAPTP